MEKWRQFLKGFQPRADLDEPFIPEQLHHHSPALLNNNSLLVATAVSVRLLHVVAMRGGTRVKPSKLEKLLSIIERSLPQEAVNYCNDEVERVLQWLEGRSAVYDSADALHAARHPEIPELEMMFSSELESRVSVAQLALRENFDLELEYYDEATDSWPRLRAKPLQILDQNIEALSDVSEPILVLELSDEQTREIPIKTMRWLMPVTRLPKKTMPRVTEVGRVIAFPGPKKDTE